MTLRITVVLRLSGRIQSHSLDELREQVRTHRASALDLDEVTLVDVAAVRFLIACEADGIALVNCSRYIHEWMHRERARSDRH